MTIYPDREAEELYIEHQSVFEEVGAGLTSVDSALVYMGLTRDTELRDKIRDHLKNGTSPL
jgi:hypothetical protein|tara:strand:- start:1896 stop:2078 length:183 start_codon:yes stop_codon:yes gene_type:complete